MTVSTCSQQQSSLLFTYISLTQLPLWFLAPRALSAARVDVQHLHTPYTCRSTKSQHIVSSLSCNLYAVDTVHSARWWECKNGNFHPQYHNISLFRSFQWIVVLMISCTCDVDRGDSQALNMWVMRLYCRSIFVTVECQQLIFSLASLAALRFMLNTILQRMNYFQWEISVFMG